ncbi:YybS family protein [Alkalicoccus urumqiensis]|nr:YybS family protein [Alkalicoccus urumqiensis]
MDQQSLFRSGILASFLFAGLTLAALLLPLIGFLLMLVLPLPFVVFTYHYGWRAGAVAGLFSLMLLVILIAPLAPSMFVIFGVTGIIMGELFRQKTPAFGVFAGTVLTVTAGVVFSYVAFMAFTSTDPIAAFQTAMEESMDQTETLIGIDAEEEVGAVEDVMAFIDGLQVIAPMLLVAVSAVTAFLLQVTAQAWMRRRSLEAPSFPPLREWSLPRVFIWYYLAAIILSFINQSEGAEGMLHTVAANVTPVMEFLMVLQGLSFLFFFFHWKQMNILLPILISLSLLIFPFMLPIVRILGIIDLGFDLRMRLTSQR